MKTHARYARVLNALTAATSRRRVVDEDAVRESKNGHDPGSLIRYVRNLERRVDTIERSIP